MMNEDPPLPRKAAIAVAILVAGLSLSSPLKPSEAPRTDFLPYSDDIPVSEFSGLKSGYIAFQNTIYIQPKALGSIVEETNPKLDGLGLSYSEKLLLDRIIFCESGWRDVCNAQFGCRGGAGIAQLIPRTAEYCSDNLGKTIDPHNERDSLECAAWLLTQTSQGPYHWGYPPSHRLSRMKDGQVWGSWSCWQSYLTY